MVGIGRALFPPLALAVAFSMIASYLLSNTLVPVLSIWLFRNRPHADEESSASPLVERYAEGAARIVRARVLFALAYLVLLVPAFFAARRVGTELFPRVDTGQFQIRVRAPDGMRLERTEEIVRGVDRAIRELAGADMVRITLANIGAPAWSYPVNGIYVWNSGPQEA